MCEITYLYHISSVMHDMPPLVGEIHAARCEIPQVAVALIGKVNLRRGPKHHAQCEEGRGDNKQITRTGPGQHVFSDRHC